VRGSRATPETNTGPPRAKDTKKKTPHRPQARLRGFFLRLTLRLRPFWRGMMRLYSQKDVDKKALKGCPHCCTRLRQPGPRNTH